MIDTYLKRDWPRLSIILEIPLIRDIGWSEKRKEKETATEEIRSAINAVLGEKLKELESKGYDKSEQRAKGEGIIKEVADLYKLSNGVKIDIIQEYKKEC
jgi:hypothetical protein